MLNTTLCYLRREDGRWLMLYRNKKKGDQNRGKWIGAGGKFEEGESPEECALREVKEETGLTMLDPVLRGIVTFVFDEGEKGLSSEYMFIYTSNRFSGEMIAPDDCPEGTLSWIPEEELETLPMWEGDRIFLELIKENRPFFSLKLCYASDGSLTSAKLDGGEKIL